MTMKVRRVLMETIAGAENKEEKEGTEGKREREREREREGGWRQRRRKRLRGTADSKPSISTEHTIG
jgi:hypothetical protein